MRDIVDQRFEAAHDEYLRFERVEKKRCKRPDLHAFLLLDELFPCPGHDMVSGAEHDEIWLNITAEQIEALTDEQIVELVRCGVTYDSATESLSMFA